MKMDETLKGLSGLEEIDKYLDVESFSTGPDKSLGGQISGQTSRMGDRERQSDGGKERERVGLRGRDGGDEGMEKT